LPFRLRLSLTKKPNYIETHKIVGFFLPMKYHRLTADQLHELHAEFSIYLATQGIDKEMWESLKENAPEQVQLHFDQFSDTVWETLLQKCQYLDFGSQNYLYFFSTPEEQAEVLVLQVTHPKCDLTTKEGFGWALEHLHDDAVVLYHSFGDYTPSRELFLYEYLKKGAEISKGEHFKVLKSYFSNSAK